MLKDKKGREITVGCHVKQPDGRMTKVTAVVVAQQGCAAHDVEIVPSDGHSKAADGDTIVWGA